MKLEQYLEDYRRAKTWTERDSCMTQAIEKFRTFSLTEQVKVVNQLSAEERMLLFERLNEDEIGKILNGIRMNMVASIWGQ